MTSFECWNKLSNCKNWNFNSRVRVLITSKYSNLSCADVGNSVGRWCFMLGGQLQGFSRKSFGCQNLFSVWVAITLRIKFRFWMNECVTCTHVIVRIDFIHLVIFSSAFYPAWWRFSLFLFYILTVSDCNKYIKRNIFYFFHLLSFLKTRITAMLLYTITFFKLH